MGKSPKKGFLLPPAVGYSMGVLTYLFGNYRISLKYLGRVILTLLINLINLPFRIYEKLFINKKYKSQTLEHPPIFIIGHWRSGTTHLHNILCQDDQMGYVNTFQSVFPFSVFLRLPTKIVRLLIKLPLTPYYKILFGLTFLLGKVRIHKARLIYVMKVALFQYARYMIE